MDAPPDSPSCPACDLTETRFLEAPSADAEVYYFRCAGCGHVWATDRKNKGIVRHVTPLTRAPNQQEA